MDATAPAPGKFADPAVTLDGSPRARVALGELRTLWFNTGTLCNLACEGCYIESSPRNDRLSYLALDEVRSFLDEIRDRRLPTGEIGFTGGEPFMNPDILPMVTLALDRGFRALVLTNAMRPMMRHADALAPLARRRGLRLRVSLDHYRPERHEEVRGPRSWEPAVGGLRWLAARGFALDVAARQPADEDEAATRAGFAGLFRELGLGIDAADPARLVLFPEMDLAGDVPEITESCWGILDVDPASVMCASSRMVVRRRGARAPVVVPCTLLPYDADFDLGPTLADAHAAVPLNHPFCAQFCVLGGASCSAG